MTEFNESILSKVLVRPLIKPEDRSQLLPLSTPVYCPSNNGVRASKLTIIAPNPIVRGDKLVKSGTGEASAPLDETTISTSRFAIGGQNEVDEVYDTGVLQSSTRKFIGEDNILDVVLNKELQLSYTVPHEVDLKTDVDLQALIRSDIAVQFKKAVSKAIHAEIVTNITSIPQLDTGEDLPKTLGLVIADNIYKGTGQRFSIYKFDNGAPVPFIQTSNQPDIDNVVNNTMDIYASYNDVGVGALHYFNNPTLILPYATFQEYQQGLCNGTIKTYVESRLNVETTAEDFGSIGEGIVGSNDSFAVGFTDAKIIEVPNQNVYAKDICVSLFYGVTLVSTSNLRKLV